jgi:diguanylate cyclase (GGDEF)-like protein
MDCGAHTIQVANILREIETTWNTLLADPRNTMVWGTLRQLTQNLINSVATSGYTTLSQAAWTLKTCLDAIIADTVSPTAEQRAHIDMLITEVCAAGSQVSPSTSGTLALSDVEQPHQQIFLLTCDQDLADDVTIQLGYYGYTVRTFTQTHDLNAVLQQTRPTAMIVDISVDDRDVASLRLDLLLVHEESIPLIVVALDDDLDARLQAVRAGGMAFFAKPISVDGLIDTLDTVTMRRKPEPYHILIIDNEPMVARTYGMVLGRAGMITREVTDPLRTLAELTEFNPDLILMDLYMPGCTGVELAALLRQHPALVSIPIVFVSGETDPGRQFAAMHSGGDDVLTKPVLPKHLVSAVTSRVNRARVLRSFMTRDHLTGLLNHTRLREQLAIEVRRAQRYQRPLTLAMIDIDHFKAVNDTYGHPAGDRVIKSLARLLHQRLRITDVIGRYGGEEFAVILPDTEAHAAMQVLDELRANFARIQHQVAGGPVSVTLSCGLASFPAYREAAALIHAADQALYCAKRSGRNCVVVATQQEVDQVTEP